MTCDELRPDYLLYAMGTMAEPESSEMRAHLLRGCETCTSGLREASAVAYSIGASVEGPAPPRRLRGRVLALGGDAPAVAMPWWRTRIPAWYGLAVAAACLVLSLVPGFLWYRHVNGVQAATEAKMRQEENSTASLREQLASLERSVPRGVPIFSLELARGQNSSEEAVKQLPISQETTDIVLALPMDLVTQSSAAEIRNGADQTVWSAARLPSGDADSAGVSIPAKLLPPGRYWLLLRADQRTIARWPFRVTSGK